MVSGILSPAIRIPVFSEETAVLTRVAEIFEGLFSARHRVKLAGGFDEPYYLAPRRESWGEIRFRNDYLSSCLHEIGHWLVAGADRRRMDDYGYWYEPDGRDAEQQKRFYRAEIKPQAMEWALSDLCGIPFRLSRDNLGQGDDAADGDYAAFAAAVLKQKREWMERGFPARAGSFLRALEALHSLAPAPTQALSYP